MNREQRITVSLPPAPDYVDRDTYPVFLSAFTHCVYFDVPDFGAMERAIRRAIEDDTEYVNEPDDSIANPANVEDREDAVAHLKERGKLREDGLPDRANSDKGGIRTTQYCLKGGVLEEHPELFQDADDLRRQFERLDELDDENAVELWLSIGKFFASHGSVPSNRSGKLIPLGDWGTSTGNYVATVARDEAGKCPNCGADKSDSWECYKSSNRTRVPDKYRCTACGYKKSGITTG